MTAKAKKSKGVKLPAVRKEMYITDSEVNSHLILQIKTMQAKIYTQELFDDDMRTDSQISIAKIKGDNGYS